MKKNSVITIASIAVLVCAVGGYTLYDYFVGNHVEIPASKTEQSATGATAAAPVSNQGTTNPASNVNKTWNIDNESKVFFSVTTSKETVNFAINNVKGSWDINLTAPDQMKATATADLNQIDSGNPKRDEHIKSEEYFNTEVTPEAAFEVKSFEGLPAEWTEGQKATFKMNGVLTVRGTSKDVQFDADAIYSQGKMNLEGTSIVRFGDFGLKSPHAILADTEENITITLRLGLESA
ncbi:YceI family protein [uncultured Brevibacillus sp.]|uniref:YceI family protein n=1 Tax=uncultured Brevibacillus sp. TaxID=169970 RepID=UPI00259817FE|nr:YceI family protein [uncultured Brevibacillus sp.]